MNGVSRPLRNDVSLMFQADDVTAAEKAVLKGTLNATKNVAGCQQLRKRMGHVLFGFRVVHGECLFWTISPNRKHSSMILKLSRGRPNDPFFDRADVTNSMRKRYAGENVPPIFVDRTLDDPNVESFVKDMNLPDLFTRLGMNAQDPLSSVHYFDFCIYVILPAAFGVRMCFSCPHCNADASEPGRKSNNTPCPERSCSPIFLCCVDVRLNG